MPSIQAICSVEECQVKPHAKGYCGRHYNMFKRYGDPLHEPKQYHGLHKTVEYKTWRNMQYRCYYPKDISYPHYGAKGVKICKRWLDDFLAFLEDMGKRPSSQHSIDRKNSAGHYSCGKCEECKANGWTMNCRWTTVLIQNWNKNKSSRNTTGYIGIRLHKGKWRAVIGITLNESRTAVSLGSYETKEEAALAYDVAAIFFRGSDAVTNIL